MLAASLLQLAAISAPVVVRASSPPFHVTIKTLYCALDGISANETSHCVTPG